MQLGAGRDSTALPLRTTAARLNADPTESVIALSPRVALMSCVISCSVTTAEPPALLEQPLKATAIMTNVVLCNKPRDKVARAALSSPQREKRPRGRPVLQGKAG
jgi:hypothetical protein